MVTILMVPVKMATSILLRIKLFCENDYDVVIFVHDITNKILHENFTSLYVTLLDFIANYNVDVVM